MNNSYKILVNDILNDCSIIVYRYLDYDVNRKCRSVLTTDLRFIQIIPAICFDIGDEAGIDG